MAHKLSTECRFVWRRTSLVAGLIGMSLFTGLRGQEPPQARDADEELLREHKVATDGPGLVGFFRARTLRPEDEKHVAKLVRQLEVGRGGEVLWEKKTNSSVWRAHWR
jgi:hypothetical protein